MTTPVQPGQPILPSMTAEWYNQTLKRTPGGGTRGQRGGPLPPGTLDCVVDGGTPVRFEAIALNSAESNNNIEYTPRVSIAGLAEHNWGVVQTAAGDTIEVCFFGLCLATVTQVSTSHLFVTYSTSNSRLETDDKGKAHLLWYNSSGPSLISIGVPAQLVSTATTVITDVQVDGVNRKLQYKTRDGFIAWDGAESAWTDFHTGTDCSA